MYVDGVGDCFQYALLMDYAGLFWAELKCTGPVGGVAQPDVMMDEDGSAVSFNSYSIVSCRFVF